MTVRNAVCAILILILAVSPVWPGTTGKVTGRVLDAGTKEPLVGVNVLLEGTTYGGASDLDGYFVILNVPPGKYNVIASALGYQKKMVTGILVQIDLTTTVNFELGESVIELGEIVEVTAEVPIVKKDLTSSESRVTSDQLKNLPVQEVSEVLSLQAGITVGTGGEIHIRGGRSNEVAYWVNGVSVTDGFDRSSAIQVDNNTLQELQVISGTFNAEYGQAMSGIINAVTKEGGSNIKGGLIFYVGDYATTDTDLYPGLSELHPTQNLNLEGSLSGPLFLKDLSFFASARYYKTDGWLYGWDYFNTDGTGGDSSLVPMNDRVRLSGQAKLTYNFSPTMKLNLTGIGSKIDFRDYSHDWRYLPDGDVQKFDVGYSVAAIWTHTLGATSFYTANASYFYKRFDEYLYEDPLDPRYIVDPTATNRDLYEFISMGTNNHQFYRSTETVIGKIDYTNQISRLHQLKAGVEGRLNRLKFDDYSVAPGPTQGPNGEYIPIIPDPTTPLRNVYKQEPYEFSVYAQDKLEYAQMIVNIGLRYDYFDSRGEVLSDPQDPNVYLPQKPENQAKTLEERLTYWYKDAKPKSTLSPRLGISYPITDQGVLHFSYGHFLQIPSFSNLYQNPGYKVTTASGVQGVYGNPDLNAEKTVMYEFGLQQAITEQISFDVTAFYKDTRDWVSTSAQIPVRDPETATSYYTTFINRDYANARGVTVWLNKRPLDMFLFNLTYTFQVAEGNNSNPEEEQGAQQANREPTRTLSPLDWDQTHTLNFNLGLVRPDWNVSLIGRYGSGLPYTPVLNQAEGRGEDANRTIPKNSRRRPEQFSMDLTASKTFELGPANLVLFLRVFNLLDRRNEIIVYGETGRAYASVENLGAEPIDQNPGRVNTVDQYILRPDFYSEPREIQLGFEVNF